MILYMCCTNDKYELAVCVNEDANEIDRKMVFCHGYTLTCISNQKNGKRTNEFAPYKFERVEVEDDEEFFSIGVCKFCGKEFKYIHRPGCTHRRFCNEHNNKKYNAIVRYREKAEERKRAKEIQAQAN